MTAKWDWKALSEHPGLDETAKATKAFLWARIKLQTYSPGPSMGTCPPWWTDWKAWTFYICSKNTKDPNNWRLGISPAFNSVLEIEATHYADLPEPPTTESN